MASNRKNRKIRQVEAERQLAEVNDTNRVVSENLFGTSPETTSGTDDEQVGSISEGVSEGVSEGSAELSQDNETENVSEPEAGESSEVTEPNDSDNSTSEPSNIIPLDPFREVSGPEKDLEDNGPVVAETKTVTKTKRNSFAGTSVITLLTKTNPKKAGSQAHTRFANYKTGMTVEQALNSGLRRDDLNWDTTHNFISIA